MRPAEKDAESWKRMVLQSMPKPAWLSEDAPHGDVVLSSRTRVMRNLVGHRFPNRADTSELQQVMEKVLDAARRADLGLEVFKGLTNAERDYLVGCRLVSPDFEWTLPGRALLISADRSLSLMINEEDHLRVQAISAGWSIEGSERLARHGLDRLAAHLPFAFSPDYGFLAASPTNLGQGRRQSAMFHLIGLAHNKRLPAVMKALAARGIVVRGLFGESSRAIGAFAQVSVLESSKEEFTGACEYLLREEREARASVTRETLEEKATQARDFAASSRMVSLADALRILAWVRWAASAKVPTFPASPRAIDAALTTLEIRGTLQEEYAARQRANYLKTALGV
jgi:protein arginine kinase